MVGWKRTEEKETLCTRCHCLQRVSLLLLFSLSLSLSLFLSLSLSAPHSAFASLVLSAFSLLPVPAVLFFPFLFPPFSAFFSFFYRFTLALVLLSSPPPLHTHRSSSSSSSSFSFLFFPFFQVCYNFCLSGQSARFAGGENNVEKDERRWRKTPTGGCKVTLEEGRNWADDPAAERERQLSSTFLFRRCALFVSDERVSPLPCLAAAVLPSLSLSLSLSACFSS